MEEIWLIYVRPRRGATWKLVKIAWSYDDMLDETKSDNDIWSYRCVRYDSSQPIQLAFKGE